MGGGSRRSCCRVMRFSGQTVVVTGSSDGIGLSCCKRFYSEGANIVISSRKREKVDAAVAEFDDASRVLGMTCHIGKSDEVAALMAAAASRFGKIDHLVCNAAI